MVANKPSILDQTLSGLEDGLHVGLITTWDPATCRLDDSASEVHARLQEADHDRMPVVDKQEHLIGIVDRSDYTPAMKRVSDIMRTLTGDMVIPEHLPIESFIDLAGEQSFRLVVGRSGRFGIVTRSDLHKLPVRLVIFALITHLEELMIQLIERGSNGNVDWWWDVLNEGRRSKVLWLEKQKHRDGLNPDRLQLTQLADKRDIINHKFDPGDPFDSQLHEIEDLRNVLAHAGDYASSDGELQDFVNRVRWTRSWIEWCHTQL